MDSSRIHSLIKKYNAGQCSPEEKTILEQWYLSFDWSVHPPDIPEETLRQLKENAWRKLAAARNNGGGQSGLRRISTGWLRYAAMALLLPGAAALYFLWPAKDKRQTPPVTAGAAPRNVSPDTKHVTLTLAGGKVLDLADSAGFAQAAGDGVPVTRREAGIAYEKGTAEDARLVYHQLSTPRGLHYNVTLSDGSRVWLNAASSLRFPAQFGKNARHVFVTGEAYFEVAADASRPFFVHAPDSSLISVLGTSFNINAYNDLPGLQATLLEGAVKISRGNPGSVLKPGQQAVVAANGSIAVSPADTANIMAWKNGFFDFRDTEFRVIMLQLSRWYDIDVRYEGKPPARKFTGQLRHSIPLAGVLKILERKDIRFRREGRTVYVTQ
ncbi:MAG: FecR family protein [Chitinophaga sp.]